MPSVEPPTVLRIRLNGTLQHSALFTHAALSCYTTQDVLAESHSDLETWQARRLDSQEASVGADGPPWLAHQIRVRVVDKALARVHVCSPAP